MISSVDQILGKGEKVEQTLNPSVFDSRYFFSYISSILMVFLIFLGTVYVRNNFSLPFASSYLLSLSILPFLYVLKLEIKRRFIMYHFTGSKVIVEEGIFDKNWKSLYYDDITHAQMIQNFEERIFDVSDLHISTAGEAHVEMTLNGVKNPHKYHKKVMEGQSNSDKNTS